MATALAAAAVGVTIFVVSVRECSLPALWWAAGLLFAFIVEDVRRQRIPNWLTLSGAGMGTVVATATTGWMGAVYAVAGILVALALLIVPFAMRGLGAGDVKALGALGAFWGPGAILGSVPWMLIAGGVMAVLILAVRGQLPAMLRRWATSVWTWRLTRRWTHAVPESSRRQGLPFALAIALGASAYQFWGPLWS